MSLKRACAPLFLPTIHFLLQMYVISINLPTKFKEHCILMRFSVYACY